MKAPEKIRVVTISKASNGLFGTWTTRPCVGDLYISKEALLEWASNRLGKVSDMGFDDGDVEHGYIRALQDVIDKLNE